WFNAVGTGNWEDAAAAYFSGWNYNNPNVSDGHYTVGQYRDHIRRNLSVLNQSGGVGAGLSYPGGGTAAFGGGLSTMFPGHYTGQNNFLGWQGSIYAYGREYGLDGVSHTGLDVGMPYGTPFYAPGPATVVCVGCYRN